MTSLGLTIGKDSGTQAGELHAVWPLGSFFATIVLAQGVASLWIRERAAGDSGRVFP